MTPSIYSILNQKTKRWWYNQQLRRQGKVQEARRRERASILKAVEDIRRACYLHIGAHRWGLYFPTEFHQGYRSKGHVSGCGPCEYEAVLARCRPEVPRVDSSRLPHEQQWTTMKFPMWNDNPQEQTPPREDGTYGSMQYVPLGIVLACHEVLGSKVHWGSWNPEEWRPQVQATMQKLTQKG